MSKHRVAVLKVGRITMRRAGRLHHLKIGAAHARRRVLAIADEQEVTVVALDTGEILSTHLIEPDRRYWRNQRRPRPMAEVSGDGLTQVSPMSRLMTLARPEGVGRVRTTSDGRGP